MIALGAALIALWVDVRFPRLAPRELAKALLHIGAALAVGYATTPAMQFVLGLDTPTFTLVAIFGIAFPAIVYSLLASFWMMKVTRAALGGFIR